MADWSTLQLAEFFSAITRAGDAGRAARIGAERAAEATDAELAAVVSAGEVLVEIGLGRHGDPAVFTTLTAASDVLTVPGIGTLYVTVQALDMVSGSNLIVARADEPFDAEERQMLQGMARVLGLALRELRTLENEREVRREREREAESRLGLVRALERREKLLEMLLRVQRSANQRAPLGDVLASITRGAGELLDGAPVLLLLRDDVDPEQLAVTSAAAESLGTRNDDAVTAAARAAMTADDVREHGDFLGAPVHLSGDVAGSLVIGRTAGDVGDADRNDVLLAFAEQASLALTGAHTLAAVRQAYHDPLTRLPNRALFLERLERTLSDGPVAVLYLDLDLFKQVNDSLGHAAGDELLRGVAGRLRAAIRDTDMAARLGGDEFAVLLEPVDDPALVHQIADRIVESVARPFRIAGKEVLTRASVGIAHGAPGRAAEDLLEDADLAMYRAKKTSPGTCRVFEPRMRTELLRQVALGTEATRAFEARQFVLRYQPLVDVASGGLVAVEALLRWTHPDLGPVPPGAFIALAEQSGLILDLGRWVLHEACAQLSEWHRAGLPGVALNVNLSGRQLADDRIVEDVRSALATNDLAAGALTLEVTEAGLAKDRDRAEEHLAALRALGVRLSLDDFGSEPSSVATLSRHPFDQLKIDKSVLDGTPHDRRRLVVARTLFELGAGLGMQTVAEGVEDAAQLRALRTMPCDLVQGFLLARPMSPEAIPGLAGLPVPARAA